MRKILVEKSGGGTPLARDRLRQQDNIKTKLKEVSFFIYTDEPPVPAKVLSFLMEWLTVRL